MRGPYGCVLSGHCRRLMRAGELARQLASETSRLRHCDYAWWRNLCLELGHLVGACIELVSSFGDGDRYTVRFTMPGTVPRMDLEINGENVFVYAVARDNKRAVIFCGPMEWASSWYNVIAVLRGKPIRIYARRMVARRRNYADVGSS